jgi:RHS repeat-associated protein
MSPSNPHPTSFLTKKTKGALAETWTYGYDAKNELISAKRSATDGGAVNLEEDYKYDPFGNRVEVDDYPTGPGGSENITRFAYDGWDPAKSGGIGLSNFDVWADLDGQNSNALLTRYIRDDNVDGLLARIDSSGNLCFTLTDRQGSVVDVTDNTGVVKDAITYDGWGQITNDTNITYRGRYGYTGREEDQQTGLQFNRARYYDPVLARWTTQDPLGFDAGDSNLYRYVSNGPTYDSDPGGLQRFLRHGPPPAAPPPMAEGRALGILRGEIKRWEGADWNIAADFLQHFIDKTGGKTYTVPAKFEGELIQESQPLVRRAIELGVTDDPTSAAKLRAGMDFGMPIRERTRKVAVYAVGELARELLSSVREGTRHQYRPFLCIWRS